MSRVEIDMNARVPVARLFEAAAGDREFTRGDAYRLAQRELIAALVLPAGGERTDELVAEVEALIENPAQARALVAMQRRRMSDELNATFQRVMQKAGLTGSVTASARAPRYRQFIHGSASKQIRYCWNTERMSEDGALDPDGGWYSWLYVPKGAGKGLHWEMREKMRHATRTKARERAEKRWRAAKERTA
jgi:hypothetical protein